MHTLTDSSPVRRRMTKEARRAQLLASAEQVFGELGYTGATMEEIAARSGVARSLLYEHFDSLDEVYLECLRTARAELDRRMLAAATQVAGPSDRLQAGIRAYFTFVKDHGSGWDVLFGSSPVPSAAVGKIATELRFATVEQIAGLLASEMPEPKLDDARAYAHVISGAGEQLARWWRQHPNVPLEAVVEHMMTVVWQGLHAQVDPSDSR